MGAFPTSYRDRPLLTRIKCSTKIVLVKNITIKVDEEVARWARVWAAEHDTSISRMLGEKLAEMMQADRRYQAAQRRFLAREPGRLRSGPGESWTDRDALHER
jgi:hypothetical protein